MRDMYNVLREQCLQKLISFNLFPYVPESFNLNLSRSVIQLTILSQKQARFGLSCCDDSLPSWKEIVDVNLVKDTKRRKEDDRNLKESKTLLSLKQSRGSRRTGTEETGRETSRQAPVTSLLSYFKYQYVIPYMAFWRVSLTGFLNIHLKTTLSFLPRWCSS